MAIVVAMCLCIRAMTSIWKVKYEGMHSSRTTTTSSLAIGVPAAVKFRSVAFLHSVLTEFVREVKGT